MTTKTSPSHVPTQFQKIADGIEYAPDGDDFGIFRVALTGGKPSKSGKSLLTANSGGFQPLKAGVKYTIIVSRSLG